LVDGTCPSASRAAERAKGNARRGDSTTNTNVRPTAVVVGGFGVSRDVDVAAIPSELKERNQWLLWDASADTPRRPHWDGDFSVSWSDPEAWHSFGEAVAKAEKRDSWGVGYVTAAANDDAPMGVISVIDMDGCADPDDRPKDWLPSLDPFADRDAYLEWSASHAEPGDSGIHAPVAGTPPEWWRDIEKAPDVHEGVDVLSNKFCVFTGDRMEGISGDEIPTWEDWTDEWLADAYEAIQGETAPPRHVSNGDGSTDSNDDSHGSSAADDLEIDAEMAEEMLAEIDPDCPYETWRNIGFALSDRFPSSTAERLFKAWSRDGSKYDRDADRYIEDIANRGSGGIGIGTLWHHAEEAGWEPDFGEEYDGTPSARELVARHSDEFDDVSEVPDDIFQQDRAPAAAVRETDGGAAAADPPAPPEEPDGDEEPSGPWESVYFAYKGAEDADERLPARYEATEQLATETEWRGIVENDSLWIYKQQKGIFEPDGDERIREALVTHLKEQFRAQEQREIAEQLRGRNTVSESSMGGPEGLIAAENCVIDLLEEKTRDHSPDYNFMSRLGCEFDPDAACPRWRAFLQEVVDSETDRQKLQEFAGYFLHHWEMPYHKALFLVGPTASGKSTFLDAINAMLGEDTAASLTPQQMTSERFGGAELFNKWANIRNDIPAETVENTGAFKEIIGGDPIKAEEKYQDPFMFRPTAKHAFSANQLPDANTDDEAFFRRILLVPFPETVPKAERDPMLDQKLQNELSGILNWALEGLQRLLANGGFTGDRSPGRTRETWEKWGNSVDRFKKAALETGGEPIPKHKVYAAYLEYCRQESMPSETQHLMTRKLKQEGFEDGRAYVDGHRERVFMNIAWTSRGEDLFQAAQDRGSDEGEDSGGGSATGLDGFGQ
jgi:putative DNA primase/helicase